MNVHADVSTGTTRKILTFKNECMLEKSKTSLIEKYNCKILKNLNIINSLVVEISNNKLEEIIKENIIFKVEDDLQVEAFGKQLKPMPTSVITSTPLITPSYPNEVIPWGIKKINADLAWAITSGNHIKVAVLDSGIELLHPDLKLNIKGGVNTINSKLSINDDYGHGTHIAGTIAAIDNEMGVIGVAPNIDLYAVKVLNSQGDGYISDIIEGIDWCIRNGIKVVNMSFGTTMDSQALHDAVIRANEAGVIQISASGNNGGNINNYPAAYPEVLSIGAIDSTNNIFTFSNTGKVDFVAPGVDIFSTYLNSDYLSISGTSMAAAHVTGIVSLMLSVPQKCDLNKDGFCSIEEVKQKLESTSLDLGSEGKDSIFGAGLVDAFKAVQ